MCQGKTKEGKDCKRKEEPFCYLHRVPSPGGEMIDLSHLPKSTQGKFLNRRKKPPSLTDGEGYIYVYVLGNDKHEYYKIGRTARTPEKRLKEWKGSKLKEAYVVHNQKRMERLIHLYLDHVRIYRYEVKPGVLCSVWKKTGEPVTPEDARLKEEYKLSALGKQIEWFRIEWDELREILRKLIKL